MFLGEKMYKDVSFIRHQGITLYKKSYMQEKHKVIEVSDTR